MDMGGCHVSLGSGYDASCLYHSDLVVSSVVVF